MGANLPLRLQLIRQVPEADRCEHLRVEEDRVYSNKGRTGDYVDPARELACDGPSLQMWCLDPERKSSCIFYSGEQSVPDIR